MNGVVRYHLRDANPRVEAEKIALYNGVARGGGA